MQPKKSHRFAKSVVVIAMGLMSLSLLTVFSGCEDPPPPPAYGAFLLGIRTVLPTESTPTLAGGMGETLEGLSALRVNVTRVDVVHRTDKNDPGTEQVITVDTTEHTIELQGDLAFQAPRQIAFLNVPVGFVQQFRFIVSGASISLRGEDYVVKVPSGDNTGLKVLPMDGEPFEIIENERTAGRIAFEPFKQLIRNKGQGFMMKPVLEAEHVSIPEVSSILLDRIVVRFHDGVSRPAIDRINSLVGTTVLDQDGPTNYFVLKLPVSITLEQALEFYKARPEVRYALQDFVVYPRISRTPCDEKYDLTTFDEISAPSAWGDTIGSRNGIGIMAVVDFDMNLKSRDMLPNWFINQDEVKATPEKLNHPIVDVDGDDRITFIDLNDHILGPDPANPQNKDLCKSGTPGTVTCDRDGDGLVTPLDIADGNPDPLETTDFENNKDDGGNEKVDDLVGWDFVTGDNSPHRPGPTGSGCDENHGTVVASLMAAEGTDMTCPSLGIAGLNWEAQLIPIQPFSFPSDFDEASTRSSAYMAFQYAAGLGADVINASFGNTITAVPIPDCPDIIPMEQGKLLGQIADIGKEAEDLTFPKAIIVAAGENCRQNDDIPQIFDWPVELAAPNVIAVASKARGEDEVLGAVGVETFDLASPAKSVALVADDNAAECGGTSVSTPLVSGTIGLMVASPYIPSCVKGNAIALKNCFLNRMAKTSALTDFVALGRTLYVSTAVQLIEPVETTCPCP